MKVPLFPTVLPTSSPSLVSVTPRTTSIMLVWTQPAGEVVDSYLITYSFTVTGCPGVDGNSMVTVSGSSSSHTLTGLGENSVFTISILARNGAGDSQTVITTTSTLIAGTEVMSTAVLIIISLHSRVYSLQLPPLHQQMCRSPPPPPPASPSHGGVSHVSTGMWRSLDMQ